MNDNIDQINYSPSFKPNEPYNLRYESKAIENLKIHSYDKRTGIDLYDFYNNSTSLFQYSVNSFSNALESMQTFCGSLRTISSNVGEGVITQRGFSLENISIEGKSSIESSTLAIMMAEEIEEVKKEYTKIMFDREDITLDLAKELELEMLLSVKELEDDGEVHRVNYFSLYIETIVNQTISGALHHLEEFVLSDLTPQGDYDSSTKDVDDNHSTVVYFNKTASMLKYYLDKDISFRGNAIQCINNIFIALEKYEQFLQDEIASNGMQKSFEVFKGIDRDACILVSENVSNLIKVFESYKQNKELILSHLSEMHEIRKYYYK